MCTLKKVMRQTALKSSRFRQPEKLPLLSSALLTVASLTLGAFPATAQVATSTCQQPRQDEYLVLVVSETKESQQQIRRALPGSTQATVCKYLDNTVVTRIGGFRSVKDANNWLGYVNEIVTLPAFIARPATPQASTSPNALAYKPRALGTGYAVLVDYFNQPQVAAQVRQLLGGDVGLVSFGQRPYLLAVYTSNEREANSTLQQLSARGFLTMLVDSSKVTLLKPQVISQ